MSSGFILLIAFGIAIVVFFAWRLASHRYVLPCPPWLGWLVELDNPLARTNRADFIVSHLDLQAGMHVLDAGCGPGRLTVPVADYLGNQGSVLAMDIQQGMLERVKDKVNKCGLKNVDYLAASLGNAELPTETFDRALLVAVLGEIPDRDAAIGELYSTLKPGGVLAVAELVFDPHYQPRSTVLTLAKAAGFKERSLFGNRLAYLLLLEKPAVVTG